MILSRSRTASGIGVLLGFWIGHKWVTPIVGLLGVFIFFACKSEHFATSYNMRVVAAQTVQVGICGIGMTLIMIGGGIDLSVGSVMALAAVAAALALKAGYSSSAAVAVAMMTGALCGLANALLITGLRIIPFIATLGTLSAIRGLTRWLANNQVVRLTNEPESLVGFVQPLGSSTWLAPAVWVTLAVGAAAAVVLNWTAFGRRTVALGSNELAARLSGVRVNRQKVYLYTLGGLFAGLAGLLTFANMREGDPTASAGIELQVIAAVVVGGGSLMGGEGSILGTLVGAFMLTCLVNGSTLAKWENYVQEIAIGAIIVVAVALDYFRRRTSP
jgi:ribose transport system permease protein